MSASHQPVALGGETSHAPVEQSLRAAHATYRRGHRLMVGDQIPALLSPAELRAALGYSRAHFHRLEKSGAFAKLVADVADGVRVYNGARLAQLLDTSDREDSGRRFFPTRHAGHRKQKPQSRPRKQQGDHYRETAESERV